ncbi:hypothetical protein RhiirA1_398703 [Rhizophagus irregularis]|uniref:Uncharacterized protein n=1 Tax=Rhizophagus irregularis TaxID=588596 RepID=A0A2N0RCQ0_9GLOM|nr:hypothetical protein RhiirA1_398703 [Rhizophagus irregularis]
MTKLVENKKKEEEIKIITGNFKELEKKKEIDTSLSNKKVKDISGQTKNNNFSGNEITDGEIEKEYIKKYEGFFEKVFRINKLKYILIYFKNENDMMNTIYKSGMEDELGKGLQDYNWKVKMRL